MKSDETSTVGEIENDEKRDGTILRRSQYLRMIYNAVWWHEIGRGG